MCKAANTNLCKLGRFESAAVSCVQYLCVKFNMVIKA